MTMSTLSSMYESLTTSCRQVKCNTYKIKRITLQNFQKSQENVSSVLLVYCHTLYYLYIVTLCTTCILSHAVDGYLQAHNGMFPVSKGLNTNIRSNVYGLYI